MGEDMFEDPDGDGGRRLQSRAILKDPHGIAPRGPMCPFLLRQFP